MTKKLIPILSGILALQVVVVVAMHLRNNDYGAFKPQEKLLSFNTGAIDGISIEDGKHNSLVLSKHDGSWVLPDNGNFPASKSAVSQLLTKLADLKKGWPVATTGSAADRFKVAKHKFERKLSLQSHGKTVATLYIGTSPGFRKVHVRAQSQDDVYSVAFNTYEANTKTDDWINRKILAMPVADISRIKMPDYELQQSKDGVHLANLTDKESTNEKAANEILNKVANLSIQSLLGMKDKPDYQQDKPLLQFKVSRKNGKTLNYRISKPGKGNYYILKRSDLNDYFKIAAFDVKSLSNSKRAQMVTIKPKQEPMKAASSEKHSPATGTSNNSHG